MQRSHWALWARLRDTFWRADGAPASDAARTPPAAVPALKFADGTRGEGHGSGKLLQFPIRGEALLVRLADLLRHQAASRCIGHDSLQLTVSRGPTMRLSIDDTAYVEFNADTCSYYVAVAAAPDTLLTLESSDFDTIVSFVVQYVRGCRAEPAFLVAAP
jgi:hypothetical protein